MAAAAGNPGRPPAPAGPPARAAQRPPAGDSIARPAEVRAGPAAAELRRNAVSPTASNRPPAQPKTSVRLAGWGTTRQNPPIDRRALITGIAGQDGSLLAESLLGEGYAVYGIVRQDPSARFPNLEG